MSVFAYGEAVRHLEQALKIQEVLDPDDKLKRCDLLLALGDAMLPLENPRRLADTVAEEAFLIAEGMADSPRALRAALQAAEALLTTPGMGMGSDVFLRREEWAARADRHARPGTIERVYADCYLGASTLPRSREQGHEHLRRAMELAVTLEDEGAFFAAAAWALNNLQALRDRELVGRVVDQVLNRPREGIRSRDLSICLSNLGGILFERGERERAEAMWRELENLADRTHDATSTQMSMAHLAFIAFLDGHLEEADSLSEALSTRQRELGVGGTRAALSIFPSARITLHLGRPVEPLLGLVEGSARAPQAMRSVILSYLGRFAEAAAVREGFGDIGSQRDETNQWFLFCLFEAAILSEDRKTVGDLLPRLAPLAHTLSRTAGVSVGRLCGAASALLGQPDEARAYYLQALDLCDRVRFRPEIALTRLELAELLLAHYPDERAEAVEHLDVAIDEFRAMKMQPALERALKHKGLLSA
jgi:tetratricopeptide (TPR) repeat protein